MRGAILAAVSGGPMMDHVVDRAIALSKERGAPLTILHVIDPEFIRGRAHVPKSTEESLEHLGELLLERCGQRAAKAGVDAELRIEHGSLMDVLADEVRQTRAAAIVVGDRKYNFLTTRHKKPWSELEEETGVQLEVVRAIDV